MRTFDPASRLRSPLASIALGLALLAPACSGAQRREAPRVPRELTVTLVGTSDLHGRIGALSLLSSYVRVLRERAQDPARVLLLDGGDMFQGTLESNLVEGAVVVDAYNALGYTAAAIGNHEFDYGPVGDARDGDPQGALRARAAQAAFPFLSANLVERESRALVRWANVRSSMVVNAGGARIGIIGASTEDTPRATAPYAFAGLAVDSIADTTTREARALRAQGVDAVVLVAHAGGSCRRFDDPAETSSCDHDGELFRVLRALAPGTVDAAIGGHTHQAVAHRVAGVPLVQSYANGRSFGRIDLRIDTVSHRVLSSQIYPPRDLCTRVGTAPAEGAAPCSPGTYEGQRIEPDMAVVQRLEPAFARAAQRRAQPLGVRVSRTVRSGYERESALVNLVADAMRAARPGADVAITNSGGVRTNLTATDALTYGAVYEMMPFDNELRVLRVRARTVAEAVARSLRGDRGIIALSGLRARAVCEGETLRVRLARADGAPVADDAELLLVTSDFLTQGGDGLFDDALATQALAEPAPASTAPRAVRERNQRDAVAAVLSDRGGVIDGDDPAYFDPAHPRIEYPGTRPVRCGAASAPASR